MPFMELPKPERPAPLTGPIRTRAEARKIYAGIVDELQAIGDQTQLECYLMTIGEELIEYREQLPFFWEGDGEDFAGLDNEIKRAWARCSTSAW